ncbi:DUF397 domain-containing protein [Streptomyces sp. BE303]|uniref:DUF397 domain-containing protein n=1 Tax=Streptomyces sp. BE303 TaxID=3002528 RepID=UPI002E7A310A|nr:DUF397 domain-containing protein [Streptomyces sp. BE303]MED7954385.1 DUF397 domain-containing protein [Streptomyces sp. BE303]
MRQFDLYEIEIPPDAAAYRACGGNPQSEHETCATLREVPGVDGGLWVMGDTKRPGAELRFSSAELAVAGIDPARFDTAV